MKIQSLLLMLILSSAQFCVAMDGTPASIVRSKIDALLDNTNNLNDNIHSLNAVMQDIVLEHRRMYEINKREINHLKSQVNQLIGAFLSFNAAHTMTGGDHDKKLDTILEYLYKKCDPFEDFDFERALEGDRMFESEEK